MKVDDVSKYRRSGVDAPAPGVPFVGRWYGTATLLLGSVVLLTFAFAPFYQFYLAWIGLVPFLVAVRHMKSQRAAFLWGWGAGYAFFVLNMWWLAYVTVPGMLALLAYLALSWGAAAMLLRGTGLLDPAEPSTLPLIGKLGATGKVLLVAVIWVGLEFFRGNYPFDGLPWLYLGHAQSPLLPMIQIADLTGVYGVSLWVMGVNTWLAMLCLNRLRLGSLQRSGIVLGAILLVVGGYGVFRLSQTPSATYPGPTVLVVQPNYPQSNTGQKGADRDEIVDFHISMTRRALAERSGVDLAVWSETMMPELNPEARRLFVGNEVGKYPDYGAFLNQAFTRIQNLLSEHRIALLTGGEFFNARRIPGAQPPNDIEFDRRNRAYFFDRHGLPAGTFDKIHLVPWGEFIPFKHTIPPLWRLFLALSPYDHDYTLTAGTDLTVFDLPSPDGATTWRFVTPICFEDIDSQLVADLFKPEPGSNGQKRADLIVNITNDGWFKYNEMPQHLQVAVFRSVENRAPTARSVNTGISGFIDSVGRVDKERLVGAGIEGTSVAQLMLDRRTAWYTRIGDTFAWIGLAVTAAVTVLALVQWWRRRPTPKKA